jgi:Uma2 family endonuclease
MAALVEASFRSEERFTQEQFRAWVERRPGSDLHHYELLRGRIVMSPPARARHGRIGAILVAALERHAAPLGLGPVFDGSTGFELPSGDTVEPDVAFVSRARWLAAGPPDLDAFLRIVPDLVVETVSPSSRSRDSVEKREIYAANGVVEYWIVDPQRRSIEIVPLAGDASGNTMVVSIGPVASRVLPGLELRAEEVFAEPV